MLIAAAANPLWFVSRGLGAATLALLTASLAIGIIAGAGARSPGWPRFASAGLHRNLSLFTLVLLVLHIVTAVLDPFARISWRDIYLPFGSEYRPLWVGMGAIAFDVFIAVALTTAIRRRLGYRWWRLVHWTGYASWPLSILHGLGTGSDTRTPWMAGLTTMCLVLVAGLVGWRLTQTRVRPGVRAVLHQALAGGVALVVLFAAAGPLRPGWARAAGTPADMLGGGPLKVPTTVPPPDPLFDPTTGGHRLQVSVANSGPGQTLLMTDRSDPTLQLVVRPARAGETGPVLAVLHNGTLGCVAPVAITDTLTALCGSTLVRMTLEQTAAGTSGWLWVTAGG